MNERCRIHAKIWADLVSDPIVKKRNLDVDVTDGVVTLSGIVESEAEKKRAEELAGAIDGVVRVENELTVQRDR